MSKTLLNYYQLNYGQANYLLTHPASYLAIPSTNVDSQIKKLSRLKNIVGYQGSINERLDFKLLYMVIKSTPKINYLFAGPINHDENVSSKPVLELFAKLQRLKNFHYLGLLQKNQIPHFLKIINLGIIPYDSNELFNQLSFPLKAIEYLIAKKPVLSSGVSELLLYSNLFIVARSPADFIRQINHQINQKPTSQFLKNTQEFISVHTWQDKINQISFQ